MTIAINYSPTRTPKDIKEVFGAQVASYNWIQAFLRYSKQEKFHFLVNANEFVEDILRCAEGVGVSSDRIQLLDQRFVEENYTRFKTIMRLDPFAQQLLWQRQVVPPPGYTFCGLAHAISGIETGELLEQHCLAPSEPGDAIVCPSQAVRNAIRRFFDLYQDYLSVRFGTTYQCPTDLPVIPLGIDCEHFANITTPDIRAQQRQRLGVSDTSHVVLWVGRLSHAIKAHPLAMFLAVEKAARETKHDLHFVMHGYFVPEDAEKQFKDLAQDVCKTAHVHFMMNKDPAFPHGLWAGADSFLSLVDNVQESFGLTPLEAMAAGLPRIISDWNGYRESVRHGIDGFLIPTLQPPPGSGDALAGLLLSGREMYGGYLAKTALSVAVDHHEAAQSLIRLILNKDLGRSMAAKAKERVLRDYSWKTIIANYECCWAEAQQRRVSHPQKKVTFPSLLPQCPDPFTMYASYPSTTLQDTDRIFSIASKEDVRLLWKHEINTFGLDMMIKPEAITRLLNDITRSQAQTIADCRRLYPELPQHALYRTLVWLIKLGIIGRRSAA